jgi:hypothetical protein
MVFGRQMRLCCGALRENGIRKLGSKKTLAQHKLIDFVEIHHHCAWIESHAWLISI